MFPDLSKVCNSLFAVLEIVEIKYVNQMISRKIVVLFMRQNIAFYEINKNKLITNNKRNNKNKYV